MLFNSLSFGIFFSIVFLLYWKMPHKFRRPLLLIASYYFYMCWNPKYIILILFTTAVSYFSALILEKQERDSIRKSVLMIALTLCLGILFVFKYFNFASESIAKGLQMISLSVNPITLEILLPVGISFYTFQNLSYVIDVYKGRVQPEHNFGIYATFISFFPQLVAGPIERSENLLPQIKSEKTFDYESASYGLKLMAWGFFKKLAIADVVARYVDTAYSSLPTRTGFDFVVATFFFTIQIYCDFSGYSDIAIGTAKLLGVNLMTNFKSPYFSKSIKEFWDRWHISLSTWFKDYIYIPLGGNRCSQLKTNRNLFVTFLTSGLWHGANWTYVFWGGIHGLALIIEKSMGKIQIGNSRLGRLIKWLFVFAFCNISWIFFRAESIQDAFYIIKTVFTDAMHPSVFAHTTLGISKRDVMFIIVSISILSLYDFVALKKDVIMWISSKPAIIRWAVYLILIWLILLLMPPFGTSDFVYFQF